MAPKKKGNKRQDEDWEAELGEAAPTVDTPTNDQTEDGAEAGEEAPAAGGLMAALRKNKEKKKKKGKPVNDFVEGEDAADTAAEPAVDLASKQPEEGNFDEDDVFAGKPKKPIKAPAPAAEPEEGEFRVKSKKDKEKEKKEREKQRKKEQVCFTRILAFAYCFFPN
jgi:translation initiation factor 5B